MSCVLKLAVPLWRPRGIYMRLIDWHFLFLKNMDIGVTVIWFIFISFGRSLVVCVCLYLLQCVKLYGELPFHVYYQTLLEKIMAEMHVCEVFVICMG